MMKRVSLCLAAALWTFTWLPLALSQKTAADSPDVVPDAVLVARKTLDALRNGDSDFLLTVVDRSGDIHGYRHPEDERRAIQRGSRCKARRVLRDFRQLLPRGKMARELGFAIFYP